ncbi:MAG: DUF5666 domain-containing protein [Terriglobales bacterium]
MQSLRKKLLHLCAAKAQLKTFLRGNCLFAAIFALMMTATPYAGAQVAKAVGTIKSIQGDSITVARASGEITASLSDSTKILRVLPGAKDLKDAIAIKAQDLQPGDVVRVRGQASADEHTITALEVIVVKQSDMAAKQQHDLEDWQKRGVDGVVKSVDAGTGVITISPGRIGANKNIAVHIAKGTVLRRYAPGSVKFDDAKSAPIEQIKAGDQLRARGTRSADGTELNAEEIVSGSFPYIEGLIKSTDASANTITVQDVISKSPVVVNVSSDSQMWKLSPEMAQRIAMRLKGGGSVNGGRQGGAVQGGNAQGARPGAGRGNWQGGAGGGNGPPDLQRMLSRLPAIKLADLQKGDAVVILATSGGNSDAVTAIKLVAGVEAILTAAPNRSASSLLSPWSLNTSGGEGEAAQ